MKILSKSSCDLSQLNDRVNKGLKDIEIQLISDFFNASPSLSEYTHIMSENWNIEHMHMPFIPNGDDLPLEYIGHPQHNRVFDNVCKLAQKCAEYYCHDVMIIIHTIVPLAIMRNIPDGLRKVEEVLATAIECCPNIRFSIENGAICSVRNNETWFNANSFGGNVEWANYLNEKFKTNIFGTTIDICHAMMSMKATEFLREDEKNAGMIKTLEWFFEKNKDVISNIHLNNMRCIGFGRDHSALFYEDVEEDMKVLDEVFKLYDKYGNGCDITLEVEEDDYCDAVNATQLRELISRRYGF